MPCPASKRASATRSWNSIKTTRLLPNPGHCCEIQIQPQGVKPGQYQTFGRSPLPYDRSLAEVGVGMPQHEKPARSGTLVGRVTGDGLNLQRTLALVATFNSIDPKPTWRHGLAIAHLIIDPRGGGRYHLTTKTGQGSKCTSRSARLPKLWGFATHGRHCRKP